MLGTFSRKFRRAIENRGILSTLKYGSHAVAIRVRALTPAARRDARLQVETDRQFDEEYGVSTGGMVDLSTLNIGSENWTDGVRYQPTAPGLFKSVIAASNIRPEDFVFVDFGSGKGRVVLLAALQPFKRVIGVEFSPDLNRIALENVGKHRARHPSCCPVDLVCQDASEFAIPDEPVVLYFYNPFGKRVFSRVATNIAASIEGKPRRVVVLYINPFHKEILARVPGLRTVHEGGNFTIMDNEGSF